MGTIQVVQVHAKPVASLLIAYRKDVINVYHSNDGNRPRLDPSEKKTRLCEALFKTKTL